MLLLAIVLAGCSDSSGEGSAGSSWDEHLTGSMELKYANQFHVDYYDDGISVITVEDGLRYLVTEDTEAMPDWLPEDEVSSMTVIQMQPISWDLRISRSDLTAK